MGFFNRLFRKKKNWEELDDQASIYPDASISLLSFESEDGEALTGWVDTGYEDYPFKQYCPYNILVKVNLKDPAFKTRSNISMEEIEDYFLSQLRPIGVTHLVARIPTLDGPNLEFYLEDYKKSKALLFDLSTQDDRLVSFTCEINDDSKWRAVMRLMDL